MKFGDAGMNMLIDELERRQLVRVVDVQVIDEERMSFTFHDGRVLIFPVEWYPRLKHATIEERKRWQLLADGTWVRWPELDEDLSPVGVLLGLKSQESPRSIERWLQRRQKEKLGTP